MVVVAGGQVGIDDDDDVEEANNNSEDNDNDDYNERYSVACQSQASLAVLILIRLVVRCFPQWSTSAWQRTITGRPCPLSRFQGSSKQAL